MAADRLPSDLAQHLARPAEPDGAARLAAGRDAEVARLRGVLRQVEAAVARRAAEATEAAGPARDAPAGPPARDVVEAGGVRAGLALHGPGDPAPGAIELELGAAGGRIGLRMTRREARALAYALMRLADEAEAGPEGGG